MSKKVYKLVDGEFVPIPKGSGEKMRLNRQGITVYRKRRGEYVPIPPEWVGHTVTRRTINKRKSKEPGGKHNSKRAGKRRGV